MADATYDDDGLRAVDVEVAPAAAKIAKRLRERGNEAFKNRDYDTAEALYNAALQHTAGLEKCDLGSAQECELDKLYLNHATVLRKLGKSAEGLISAKRACELNPFYSKALFRQGQILCDLARHPEALEAFNSAQMLDPENTEIAKNILRLLPAKPVAVVSD
jgi:tetratricopeptide (TPR) repeat protein